jgi:hypothetical protein
MEFLWRKSGWWNWRRRGWCDSHRHPGRYYDWGDRKILANGAWGGTAFANAFGNGGPGGGGSGGIIELRGNVITVDVGGMIQAKGGPGGGISTKAIFAADFSSEANGGHGFARIVGTELHLDGTIDAVQVLGVIPRLDHFLCHQAKTTPKTTAFEDILDLSLVDQFENKLFDVKAVDQICNPADKNGDGIFDPVTHLEGYQIKQATLAPKFAPTAGLKVLNQFHLPGKELVVDTVKPAALLLPTAKDPDNPVANPPNPAAHNVDHYKCYTVKVNKVFDFEPILGVEIQDQFIAAPKAYDLKKPTRLCVPVDKAGEGINNPAVHLQCYQAKAVKGFCAAGAPLNAGGACAKEATCGGTKGLTNFCEFQPKHERTSVYVNNQFGPDQIDAVKEEELCVPSAKILP